MKLYRPGDGSWVLIVSFSTPCSEIATITYRSGPEWEQRFGRRMRSQEPDKDGSNPLRVPALCPDFLIETYLDHQVRLQSCVFILAISAYLRKADR